jgi:thioredoxin-like negative regulator of GroEL
MRWSFAALFLSLAFAPGCDDLPEVVKEAHHDRAHHDAHAEHDHDKHAEAAPDEVLKAQAMERYKTGDYVGFVPLQEELVAQTGSDVDTYNLACGYALTGQTTKALDALEAVAERSADLPVEKDSDLDSLRNHPRFRKILDTRALYAEADEYLKPIRKMAWERYHAEQWDEYVTIMERVAEYSGNDVDVYNLACGYALNGQTDEALTQLEALVDRSVDYGMASDSDFDSLRSDPRFEALLARL